MVARVSPVGKPASKENDQKRISSRPQNQERTKTRGRTFSDELLVLVREVNRVVELDRRAGAEGDDCAGAAVVEEAVDGDVRGRRIEAGRGGTLFDVVGDEGVAAAFLDEVALEEPEVRVELIVERAGGEGSEDGGILFLVEEYWWWWGGDGSWGGCGGAVGATVHRCREGGRGEEEGEGRGGSEGRRATTSGGRHYGGGEKGSGREKVGGF